MSPKELLYIEDALGHEKYLKSQCQKVYANIQDGELKNYVKQLEDRHNQIFKDIYGLL